MKNLSVLHVVEALTGGVYSYFMDLAAISAKTENLETTIIYSGKRKEIDASRIRENFDPRINLICLPMEREINPVADLKALLALRKTIKKVAPDLLHLHSSKAGILGRAAMLFYGNRPIIFYTPHGFAFLRNDVSPLKAKFYYFIEKWAQELSGSVTIACGDTELYHAKKLGKSLLVRNGVPVDSFSRFTEVENTMSLKVGILGRITPARNPAYFNLLAQNNPEIDFIWVGDGEMRQSLTAPNVRITGWFKDRNEGLKELNSLDVYLQTSSWEGLPIALLEAMALKKPILATNIIGNKDVVVHNKTGFLFNNATEFNEYLEKLKNPEIRERFGKEALKRCTDRFDSTKNFKKLILIYRGSVE